MKTEQATDGRMEERERDTVDQTTFQGSVPAQELPGGRSQ